MTIALAGRPITLGRRSDDDVVVDETTVSRRHALILETPNGYVLRDLSTPNGTYVNSAKVGHEETPLNHGDRIRLAGSQVTFTFRHEGPKTVAMGSKPGHTGVMDAVVVEDERAASQDERDSSLIGNDTNLYSLLQSRKGNVVTREEIGSYVWPELVELGMLDQVIDQSIERIRAAIGDDLQKPNNLITVGDVGFMLV